MNDLVDVLSSNTKLFAADASVFLLLMTQELLPQNLMMIFNPDCNK